MATTDTMIAPATQTTHTEPATRHPRHEMWAAAILAGGASTTVLTLILAGLSVTDDSGFFARNASLLVLPFIAAYFAWHRRIRGRQLAVITATFAGGALLANAYPFHAGGATEVLTALHLPMILWLATGIAHAGKAWRTHLAWMSYLRFTGAWTVYLVLFAAGGWLVRRLTVGAFATVDINAAPVIDTVLIPCVAAGLAVAAAWLVDAGHGKAAQLAPILTQALIPLLTVAVIGYVAVIVFAPSRIAPDAGTLTVVMGLLMAVLAITVHAVAARVGTEHVQVIDRIQFALIITTWGLGGVVIAVILAHISVCGATAMLVAALGASVIAFANFTWTSWVGHVMLHNNCLFERLDRFQTAFLPVYAVWSAVVVIALPPVFGFA